MGLWRDQVLPRATDTFLSSVALAPFRAETVSGLAGTVLEIGFGSGLNLGFYPPSVTRVLTVEPSSVARRLAKERIAATPFPVENVGLDAESLPLLSASVDAVVSTFTLCTLRDPQRALKELLRVLRPGGTLRFLEHGLSASPPVALWQHRLTPLQRRVAGGCHLDRRIDVVVEKSGFHLETVRNDDLSTRRPVAVFGHLYLGVAGKAADMSAAANEVPRSLDPGAPPPGGRPPPR